MKKILLITGPGGAGKTTVAEILQKTYGYCMLDGDQEDTEFFPKGGQWLPENSQLLALAHQKIIQKVKKLAEDNKKIVVDYIIFGNYADFMESFRKEFRKDFKVKVLFPSEEVTIQRDAERECWTTGSKRIKQVRKEFLKNKDVFGHHNFIDTSTQTPEETAKQIA